MLSLGQVERYLIHEFIEDYEDGLLTRRGLVRRVIGITGGVAAAATAATAATGFGVKPVLTASSQYARDDDGPLLSRLRKHAAGRRQSARTVPQAIAER